MKDLLKLIRENKMVILLTAILTMAVIGIAFAIIGHYGGKSFDWKWFLFFDCPLYAFVIWVGWKLIPMIGFIYKENEKKYQNEKH